MLEYRIFILQNIYIYVFIACAPKWLKKFKLKCRGNLNVEETRDSRRERIKEFQF